MDTIVWGILFVVFVVVEICTLGLTTIWFAVGALLAVILSALSLPLWLQIAVFLIVSCVLLFFTRPIAKKHFNGDRVKTNAESLIGTVGVVTQTIDNLHSQGNVLVRGQEWMARSEKDDMVLEVNRKVVIKDIQGVKLIVAPES